MATPAELLGQLAQQFEAAGNSQLAARFRGMMGLGGTTSAASQPPPIQQAGRYLSGAEAMTSLGQPSGSTGPITGSGSPIANQLGPRPPQGPNLRGTFNPQPSFAPKPQFRPDMRMGFPSATPPWGADKTAGLRGLLGQPGAGPQSPNLGPTGPRPRPPSIGVGGPAPPAGPAGWQGVTRPFADPKPGAAMEVFGGGRPPPTGPGPGKPPWPAGGMPMGGGAGGAGAGGVGARPVQVGAPAMGAAMEVWSPGKAAGKFGLRNPMQDFRTLTGGYEAGLMSGTGKGKYAKRVVRPGARFGASTIRGGAVKGAEGVTMAGGRLGKFAAGNPFAAKSLAFMRVANPLFITSIVGDMVGVNEWFDEGGASDLLAEGALVGASFGAVGGLPAALIGAAIGSTLNVLSDGMLVDIAQKIPIVGGMFGGEEVYDIRDDALKFFTQAATAQGSPEMAKGAAAIFDGYANMIEAGKLPAGSEMQYILQAGRTMGLTGFPWEPEALTPVYSAEDLAQITSSINDDLRPMYDVAQGLMQQNFDHISDPKVRERMLMAAQTQGSRVMEGIAVSLRGPTSMAMLSEANRPDTGLAGQLAGGNEEFAALLAG